MEPVHVKIMILLTGIPIFFSSSLDDLTKAKMGSSGDSEKIIQRLTDELREAKDLANTEKHKCMELQGDTPHLQC